LLLEVGGVETFPDSEVEFSESGELEYLDVVVSRRYLSPEEGALKIT
jgi:hypothetical protein